MMVKPTPILPPHGPDLPWAHLRADVKSTTPVDYAVWSNVPKAARPAGAELPARLVELPAEPVRAEEILAT
eukprot:1408531-Pyramimonas_sp.AAC.1